MEIDPSNCWDCPVTVAQVAGHFAVILGVAIVGPWLLRRRVALIQALGAILLIVTAFTVLLLPIYVPRWGILRLGGGGEAYTTTASRVTFALLAMFYFVAAIASYRRGRSHRGAG